MCLYPKLIKNRKYTSTKKNGGVIPPLPDDRMKYVPVGCGNCLECRKQKARGWQVRLLEDLKQHKNGKFITLTFSNESIVELIEEIDPILEGYEIDNEIATLATRRFLERYRKIHKTSIRHWLVTEIGHNGTENIHLHGIIWTDKPLTEIETIWKYGFMWKGKGEKQINYVNEQTINYIIKYITKIDEKHKTFKGKILTSPGIGSNYETNANIKKHQFKGTETNELYRSRTGHKIALPIYFRNKMYSEEEREKLWINRLDKNERWVVGERIDISKDEGAYWRLLKYYQEVNTKLGYGNDTKDWSRTQYEKERRGIMLKQRIKNAETANAYAGEIQMTTQ